MRPSGGNGYKVKPLEDCFKLYRVSPKGTEHIVPEVYETYVQAEAAANLILEEEQHISPSPFVQINIYFETHVGVIDYGNTGEVVERGPEVEIN